ncbi:MAG TPA: hybrid sensor histidine kinase/response regulator [Usitatibacter sp.]|jgi:signal transduction histidine kinase/ActR/RegA family two-component response regulator|nr:hybrid sensor histidine kinase/response regulator [Usitatibacter sp.]
MPYGAATPAAIPPPPAATVVSKILEQHFSTYQRAFAIAAPFAILALWVLRDALPHTFLALWAVIFLAINLVRSLADRKFKRTPPPERIDRVWALRATAGHGFGGAAWGLLGAATIVLRPDAPEYSLILLFIITIFATFQVANPSRYPPAYYAWLAGAMVPTLSAALLQNTDVFRALFALGVIFIFSVTVVGRRSHRLMADGIARDLERARLMQDLLDKTAALDEANRAKTRFLAAASHDLRQPMQAVVLLVESLQERISEPAHRRIVESIRTSVVSMATLLNAILDVSKFDAGTVKPDRAHFRLSQVLDRLANEFTPQARQKGLTLRVRPSDVMVETDPVLLYRILANLCNNALRYTHAGGILVGCRRRGRSVSVEVWDTGIGIPADQHAEIFREFHQLANPQRERGQGLGLGLAIVQRTAKLLDHPLGLRSREGSGSVFSITLPRGDPTRVRVAEPARAEALEGSTVLVVDDEAEVRAAMSLLLEGWGVKVLAAANGTEADAILAASGMAPDMALVDYRLPGEENGVQLLARLRGRYPRSDGILVTGDIAPEVLREARDAGFEILHKPLRPARLRSLLGAMWRRQVTGSRVAAPAP